MVDREGESGGDALPGTWRVEELSLAATTCSSANSRVDVTGTTVDVTRYTVDAIAIPAANFLGAPCSSCPSNTVCLRSASRGPRSSQLGKL
eukprot:6477862-Pyramimonas_sp.AAC.1